MNRTILKVQAVQGLPLAPPLGRSPGKIRDHAINSDKAIWTMSWVKGQWAEYYAEDCPRGQQYRKVIDLVKRQHIYELMLIEWEGTSLDIKNVKPVSYSTFVRIFNQWMEEDQVRMREKKNVSGKCDSKLLSSSCNNLIDILAVLLNLWN